MSRRMRQTVAGGLALIVAVATHGIAVPPARAEAPAGQITWAGLLEKPPFVRRLTPVAVILDRPHAVFRRKRN